jgi:hypothetical protein
MKKNRKIPKPFIIREIHRNIAAVVIKHPGLTEYGIFMKLYGEAEIANSAEWWEYWEIFPTVWGMVERGLLDRGFEANKRTLELFDTVVV